MTSENLEKAVALIKAGNRQAALPLLKEVIRSEPNNEMAWLWLYACVENPSQKLFCLQKVLEINPNNQNARIALGKLAEQPPSPKLQTVSSPAQQPRVIQSSANPTPQPINSPAQQKVIKRPANSVPQQNLNVKRKQKPNRILLIGGVVFILLICIGGVLLGGNFVYENFINSDVNYVDEQIEPPIPDHPRGDPDPTAAEITNAPIFDNPDDDLSPTPNTPSLPSITPPNIRYVPYSFKRLVGKEGWDTLEVTVALDNDTDYSVSPSMHPFKIRVSQGFEYYCSTLRSGIDRISYIPPRTRHLFYGDCNVPTATSGFTMTITYNLVSLTDNNPSSIFCNEKFTKCNTWNELTAEINPEATNPNLTFPFLESIDDIESYANEHNIKLLTLGQSLDIFTSTINFALFDYDNYGKPYTSTLMNVKSNHIGGNTYLRFMSIMYYADGRISDWDRVQANSLWVGPGLSVADPIINNLNPLPYKADSYLFINYIENSAQNLDSESQGVFPYFILLQLK